MRRFIKFGWADMLQKYQALSRILGLSEQKGLAIGVSTAMPFVTSRYQLNGSYLRQYKNMAVRGRTDTCQT